MHICQRVAGIDPPSPEYPAAISRDDRSPLSPYGLEADTKTDNYPLRVFTGYAFPCNDIGGVATSFQRLCSGGDRGSRKFFAGERGGGRNAIAAKSLK